MAELRGKTEEARREIRDAGRSALGRPALMRCAEWLIRALLGAILAGGRVLGGASPFGVALVGACGPGWEGFAALLGSVFGYLVSRGLEEGLRYAAGSALVFSVSFAFYDLKLYRRQWFMPLTAALLNGITGVVTLSAQRWTASRALALTGELALTAAGVYAFRWAFSLWTQREARERVALRQRLGLVALGAAALISLSEVELAGTVSVGRLFACIGTAAAGCAAGAGAGAAVGVAAGLAMDLSAGGEPIYAVSYALGGLVVGLLRHRRRVTAALGFALAGGTVFLWSWARGAPLSLVWETAAGSLVFLLLPEGVLGRLGLLFPSQPGPTPTPWAAQTAQRRLREAAGAFSEVFAALRGAFSPPPEGGESPNVIFDRAANRVCAGCILRERCWQSGYEDTYDLLSGVLPQLLEGDDPQRVLFPQRFRDRCVQFPAFFAAVREELGAYRLRRQYAAQLGESRRAVCDQYGDMARVLSETAEAMAAPLTADVKRTRRLRQFLAGRELRCDGLVFFDDQGRSQIQLTGEDAPELAGEVGRRALAGLLDLSLSPAESRDGQVFYHQMEPLMALAGVAGRRRRGQEVSGDAGCWFKDDRGVLFILLCDGMGSGPDARRDSELALHLLEKFLRAGVTAENALKTLDQALGLRGEAGGGFSTVDLLQLDLYTGQGALYKLGAAPSYLKRGGCVTRLAGDALPAGLGDAGRRAPDRICFQVGPGDSLVLLTDGVLDGEDDWLRAKLAGFEGESPAALAEELVGEGEEGSDDKTALVLRVGLRAPEEPEAPAEEAS